VSCKTAFSSSQRSINLIWFIDLCQTLPNPNAEYIKSSLFLTIPTVISQTERLFMMDWLGKVQFFYDV
jgi:hypothetical protein